MNSDDIAARWSSWDGATTEDLVVRWDNGGWTAEGRIDGLDLHYVIRLTEDWQARQFLLFRDLEEPDLWLALDVFGRWGEVNGAARDDLDGCTDLGLGCTPFTHSLPIRRLGQGVGVGESVVANVAWINPETLGIVPVEHRYTRIGDTVWYFESDGDDAAVELAVDRHGLVVDHPSRFRRHIEENEPFQVL